MSTSYNTVLRQIALSVNSFANATSPVDLETAYSSFPLVDANFGSSILPFTSLKDKMLNAEALIITQATSTGEHPYRGLLLTQTAPLAYGDLIPTTAAGVKIIGIRGAIRDSASGEPCTRNELEQIRARVINPGGMYLIEVFWYAIDDERIYHTRTNVMIDVCTYERLEASTLDLTANIILPDDAVPAMVHGALMECIRDDEFLEQGARFGQIFQIWVNAIKSGYTSIDPTASTIEKVEKAA